MASTTGYTKDGCHPVQLRNVVKGDFFRRKSDAKKTYTRGAYIIGSKFFECNDEDDISRAIYLKGSTVVWVGFTY